MVTVRNVRLLSFEAVKMSTFDIDDIDGRRAYLSNGGQHVHPTEFDVRLKRFTARHGITGSEPGDVSASDDEIADGQEHYRALRISEAG